MNRRSVLLGMVVIAVGLVAWLIAFETAAGTLDSPSAGHPDPLEAAEGTALAVPQRTPVSDPGPGSASAPGPTAGDTAQAPAEDPVTLEGTFVVVDAEGLVIKPLAVGLALLLGEIPPFGRDIIQNGHTYTCFGSVRAAVCPVV